MSLETKAISTEEMKEKLRNLKEYMPKEEDVLYSFGRYLAKRLEGHPELVPEGFNVTVELALHDLQKGIDGYTQKPIQSRLVGYPPIIYSLLRMRTPDIAKAVCPEDFAEGVRKMYEEVNAKLREKK